MNKEKIRIMAEELYENLKRMTTSPRELGYVLFLAHVMLYMFHKKENSTLEQFINDYAKDFIAFCKDDEYETFH